MRGTAKNNRSIALKFIYQIFSDCSRQTDVNPFGIIRVVSKYSSTFQTKQKAAKMEIGDIVVLDKIGSMKMLIIEINDDKATCMYDNGKEVHSCLLPTQFLMKVEGNQSPSSYFRLPKK